MRCLIDYIEYTQKPDDFEAGKLSVRFNYAPIKNVTPKDLAKELISGKSITASVFKKVDGVKARGQNYWLSQDFMCLDFDNTKTIHIGNQKTKIKDVTMTLEQAIEEFKDMAMFIYTSFNHTNSHPKFRVVIGFDRTVTDQDELRSIFDYFYEKYPNSDSSCYDSSRMFYGGKELFEINYDNKINVDDYVMMGGGISKPLSKATTNLTQRTLQEQDFYHNPYASLALIRSRDWQSLREMIGQNGRSYNSLKTVESRKDFYEFVKNQPIQILFGLEEGDKKVRCPFHEDDSPSASFFRHNEHDYWMFNCHVCESDRAFNTSSLIEYLIGDSVVAKEFMSNLFNVRICESEWKKKQVEIIEHNTHKITDTESFESLREIHKIIRNQKYILLELLSHARVVVGSEKYSDSKGNAVFYLSVEELAKRTGKVKSNIAKYISILCFLGFINKVSYRDLSKECQKIVAQEKAERIKSGKRTGKYFAYTKSLCSFPDYAENYIRDYIHKQAIKYKYFGITVVGFTRELLLRNFGIEEADRVYPQDERKKDVSEKSKQFEQIVTFEIKGMIKDKGYALEKELLCEIEQKYGIKEYMRLKMMLQDVLKKNGLKQVFLTNDLKNKINWQGKANARPRIIIPRGLVCNE